MKLSAYNKKRKFRNTPEPAGKPRSSVKEKPLQFVVQRHDASHLHYDFRLEVDGVLMSWAVPKGPSMNPNDKRLAVMVEDHPLSYGKFEGVIPEGNYGAGTVEIWDHGTYSPESSNGKRGQEEMVSGIKKGSLKLQLHGNRLKGSFALVRMKRGNDKNWLLMKHRDEFSIDSDFNPDSIPGEEKTRMNGESKHMSHFIKPMLTQPFDHAFDNAEWLFEIKWDGYRAIAEIGKKIVKLYSRNGLSFAKSYPLIMAELKKIKASVILDGEIVMMDEHNKPSFQKLQQYGSDPKRPIAYYVFDCLSYNGKSSKGLPLTERKELVKKVLPGDSPILRYADHVNENGIKFFDEVRKMQLEGIIAKRAKSLYFPGKRSMDWLKIKNQNTQEAIIAGFTEPKGSRKYFGALILGIRQGKTLIYIGHTGTGFTEKTLQELHQKLEPLIRKASPFDKRVPVKAGVTWVEPKLVCELKFAEVTEGGVLRHPVFQGLRVDKSASEVDHLDPVATAEKVRRSKISP